MYIDNQCDLDVMPQSLSIDNQCRSTLVVNVLICHSDYDITSRSTLVVNVLSHCDVASHLGLHWLSMYFSVTVFVTTSVDLDVMPQSL